MNTYSSAVLGTWTRHATFDFLTLSNAPEGKLLLGSSSSTLGQHAAILLSVTASSVAAEWGVTGSGSLTGPPQLTREGLGIPHDLAGLTNYTCTPFGQLVTAPIQLESWL